MTAATNVTAPMELRTSTPDSAMSAGAESDLEVPNEASFTGATYLCCNDWIIKSLNPKISERFINFDFRVSKNSSLNKVNETLLDSKFKI
jgi:hypothetical protein